MDSHGMLCIYQTTTNKFEDAWWLTGEPTAVPPLYEHLMATEKSVEPRLIHRYLLSLPAKEDALKALVPLELAVAWYRGWVATGIIKHEGPAVVKKHELWKRLTHALSIPYHSRRVTVMGPRSVPILPTKR